MQTRVLGSIKNKITATDLIEERKNCDFDQEKLRVILHGGELSYKLYKDVIDEMTVPELKNHYGFMEMDPNEK